MKPVSFGVSDLQQNRMRLFLYSILALVLCVASRADDDLLPPMTNGVPSEYASRRAGAEVNAGRKIIVTNEGLYKITYNSLVATGIDSPVGSELRLFNRTSEVALVTTSAGAWGTNDYAVFYGQPHDGYWTRSNVYWLGVAGSGLRMTQRNAAPQPGFENLTSHWKTVRYEPKNIFASTYLPQNGSFDHWFAHHIYDTVPTNIYIATPNRIPSSTSTVFLALWGRTSVETGFPDHVTWFQLNGGNNQTSSFDGFRFHLSTNSIAQNSLSNGMNTIRLQQRYKSPNDIVSLQWAEIVYQASNRLTSGKLSFSGERYTNNYVAAPWNTNEAPWLLDIRQPNKPVRLINYEISGSGVAGELRWGDYAPGTNRYWVASPTTLVEVAVSQPIEFRDLTNTARRFDYIIITETNLATAAYQLAKYRENDGMRVLMVPIENVYDEFSYGIKDARAIKQFLGYAYHHWAISPKYTLLVGDGSYDPQNNLKLANPRDPIPVYMGVAPFEYSAQDNWYAAVDGNDILADIQIGRFPFDTSNKVANAIQKIIGFEASPSNATWRNKALLVADKKDPPSHDFKKDSNDYVKPYLPAQRYESYLDDQGNQTAVNRAIITNRINEGIWSVNYFGHGGPLLWDTGFDSSHIAQLRNTVWPFFTIMTCINGAFASPSNDCMAELLVARNQRGASATLSASALSVQQAAIHYAKGLYQYLSTNDSARLGDAIHAGLAELWDKSPMQQELLFYNLFGDPAQIVKPMGAGEHEESPIFSRITSPAEALSTGSITRLIQRYDDRKFYSVLVLPFATNIVTVSTGTVWDCEMELYTPVGVSVLFTNAIGNPTSLQLFSTTSARRAYFSVKSLAEFTAGSYHVALSHQFTDTDDDGLPDEWEMAKFGSLAIASATGDADHDGMSDRAEWLAGTHPNDAASALTIENIQIKTNETTVTWTSMPEGLYRLSSATNLFAEWVEQPGTILAESNMASRAVSEQPTTAIFRVEFIY